MASRLARLAPVAVALVAAGAGAWQDAAPAAVRSCAGGYAYAGLAGRRPAHGLAATIELTELPRVSAGHVAAWVGFGGTGLGPGGTTAWVQAGVSSVPGGPPRLYTEIALPGREPAYRAVSPARANTRYRIVVSMGRNERWTVRVNGRRVVGPVRLPGSTAWRPVATAESWRPAAGACNAFGYRFEDVAARPVAGTQWSALRDVDVLRRTGPYGVSRSGDSFLVGVR